MIYLDSAATSLLKPPAVKRAVRNAMETLASPGRGGHPPSLAASELVYRCREAAAAFFHLDDPSQVVFTMNATHALNLAIHSLVKPGMRVVISGYEHNSVTRPLTAAGAKILLAGETMFDSEGAVASFDAMTEQADAVICTHVSNVFGYVLPVYEIGKLCRRKKLPYIVDASQSAGLLEVNGKELGADFICMPGHKGLLGPQGTGILLCKQGGEPLLYGGSGSDSLLQTMPAYLPDRLEAGTMNVPGIAGLLAGIQFLQEQGREQLYRREQKQMRKMAEMLQDENIRVYCGDEEEQGPVLSMTSERIGCEELANRLREKGICVRAGLHCAPLAHHSAGTLDSGTLRLSFSPFLTEAQVETAAKNIKYIINNC